MKTEIRINSCQMYDTYSVLFGVYSESLCLNTVVIIVAFLAWSDSLGISGKCPIDDSRNQAGDVALT